jgi:pimeloyl-ACP methyl ester carboxylesterase
VSRLRAAGKRVGVFGAAVGVVAAGAAVGMAAERYAVGRSFRRSDPARREPFGRLRGTPTHVTADDGIDLYVEIEGDLDSDLTIIFLHGYALNQDSWRYQR